MGVTSESAAVSCIPSEDVRTEGKSSVPGTGEPWAVIKLRALIESPSPAESPVLLSALRSVAGVHQNNSVHERRQLRSRLEQQVIHVSEAALQAFQPAQEVLSAVEKHVTAMQADITALSQRLAAARTSANDVVAETGALRHQLTTSRRKGHLSSAFVSRFSLSAEERKTLAQDDVDAPFLAALARLEHIHDESAALLRSRNQRAGLEALEFAATTREEAYEKVFRFVQARCGTLNVDAEEQEDEAAVLRNAIRALRARPMLLRYCADEIGSARRASLVSRFVAALTKGGPGGMPRPIEMHAHDPMRYTNDMLAWIHQALASEKELTYRLFATDSSARGSWSAKKDYVPAGMRADDRVREHNDELALKVLNTVFDALCRPFRIRFEQAIERQLPVVTLYRLASLLEFYAGTMAELLGSSAALPELLMECNSIAMYAFFSTWKAKMESFKLSGLTASDELTPPPAVHQSMTRLDEIMATLDGSLAPRDAQQGQIGAILEVILNPLLSLCDGIAAKSLCPLEAHVFLSNCIDAMRMPLAAYSFARNRVEQLVLSGDGHIDQYIDLASDTVLRRCGLAERIRIISAAKCAREHRKHDSMLNADNQDDDGSVDSPGVSKNSSVNLHDEDSNALRPLSKQPGMDVESLAISVKNFYAMLFGGGGIGTGGTLAPPCVNKIANVRARNRAKCSVAEVLAKAHESITAAVLDPYNLYGHDAMAEIGLRDVAKVSVVLTGRM